MLSIGLTGGVGSGKSTVAQLLAEHGAVVIDADAIAREVVEPGADGLRAVAAEFGPTALTAEGRLDRSALADLVFHDPQARLRLNAILHPRIAAHTAEIMASLPPDAIVVHDVPLLVENDLAGAYELVMVVEADRRLRLERLEARGMPPEEARRRMAAQATDAERRAVADVVVRNHGDRADLASQVDEIWCTTIAPAAT
jgi:dephospho-CoA kinase